MSQTVVTNTLLVSTKTSIMLEVVRQHQTSLGIILPQCNFNAIYSYSTRNISKRQIVIFAIDLQSTLSCVNISEMFFRLCIYSPLSPQCKASPCSAKYAWKINKVIIIIIIIIIIILLLIVVVVVVVVLVVVVVVVVVYSSI